MSTITFVVRISETGRRAEALAGSAGSRDREISIDLADLTTEQRQVVVPTAYLDDKTGNMRISMNEKTPYAHAIAVETLRDDPMGYGNDQANVRNWMNRCVYEFDAEPTADVIIGQIKRILAENAVVQGEAENRAQKIANGIAAKKQVDSENNDRHAVEYDRMRAIMNDLIAAKNYDAISRASTGDAPVLRPDWYNWSWSAAGRNRHVSLSDLQGDAIDEMRQGLIDAKKANMDAEKLAWISEHGSDHLRRAVAAGHTCTRKYLAERAELEYPGFVVDFDDQARWKSRACPSLGALDKRDAILQARPDVTVEIVWLTVEPDASEEDEPEEREAIVVIDPLYGGHSIISK